MDRDGAAASLLGSVIVKFNGGADLPSWPYHHVPRQFGDFTSAKTSLGGQQNDNTISEGGASIVGEEQEIVDVIGRKNLGLFTRHLTSNQLLNLILDQLNRTATETFTPNNCIALSQKLYSSSAQGSSAKNLAFAEATAITQSPRRHGRVARRKA